MPSWVAPAVAAELWGVTVAHILAEVVAGRLGSRTEGELLFVDIDPSREACAPQARPQAYRRSLAWTASTTTQPIVTAAERDALLEESSVLSEFEIENEFADDAPAVQSLADDDVPNWDEVRAHVSRTRRPPAAPAREAA
jgi:hypothetical protein